jgi:hypothetical protein
MKYYKFLGNYIKKDYIQESNIPFATESDLNLILNLIKDKIYQEGFTTFYNKTVGYWANSEYTQEHFEKVPEIEYMLQKAKEDYPIGTQVNSVCGTKNTKLTNTPFIKGNDVMCKCSYSTNVPCTIYSNNKWAKIVKEDEFVLPEKWALKITKKSQKIVGKWLLDNNNANEGTKDIDSHLNYLNDYFVYPYTKCRYEFNSSTQPSIPYNYKEITFEQFKKYVLKTEEKMESKKIIGYKLVKPEYKKAADKIISVFDEFKINSIAYDEFKKAGVLDIWFEPVYEPEFKVGDWVYVTKQNISTNFAQVGYIGKITNISATGYYLKHTKGESHCNGIRLATPEEIKEATKPKFPDITINGYKAEFFPDYIKFGCAKISKEVFIDLDSINEYKNTNRDIKKVTIGRGEFTKEQIKEIVEYYKNK